MDDLISSLERLCDEPAGWQLMQKKTARNLDSGETETLTFKPTQQGIFTYACLMHPQMAGKIIVQ